jgi:hypothetical protein
MKYETVGYTPESVVRAVKENAPPTSYVPEADWNAWAGAAGWHEWLHTLPSKNHTETMHVAWEFGVMTSTYAFLLPEIVNDTYVAMKWLYYEVAVGAFVHPVGGFDQLPPQVIVESVKIVGADASPADEKMKEKALNQISREEQEQSIQERIKRSEELNNPTSDSDTVVGEIEDPFAENDSTKTSDADIFSEEEPTGTEDPQNMFSEHESTTSQEEESNPEDKRNTIIYSSSEPYHSLPLAA